MPFGQQLAILLATTRQPRHAIAAHLHPQPAHVQLVLVAVRLPLLSHNEAERRGHAAEPSLQPVLHEPERGLPGLVSLRRPRLQPDERPPEHERQSQQRTRQPLLSRLGRRHPQQMVQREPRVPLPGRQHDQHTSQRGQHLGEAGPKVVRQQARPLQQVLQADVSHQKRAPPNEIDQRRRHVPRARLQQAQLGQRRGVGRHGRTGQL